MKKRIPLILTLIASVATVCILASSCAKPANRLNSDFAKTSRPAITAERIEDLDGYEIQSIDSYGIALAAKTQTVADKDGSKSTSTFYVLYDLAAKKEVGKAQKDNRYMPLNDGLYGLETRNDEGDVVKTAFYGRGGLIGAVDGDEDAYVVAPCEITYDDGKGFYLDFDGNPVKYDNRGFRNHVKACDRPGYTRLSDNVYYAFDNNSIAVLDVKNDKARSHSTAQLFGTASNWALTTRWNVGGEFFYQYEIKLPDDSKNYQYVRQSNDGQSIEKYNLATWSYDIDSRKAKLHDGFKVRVENVDPIAQRDNVCAILSCRKIENKALTNRQFIQAYDKNLKVYSDLQKELPGADGIQIDENITILTNGDTQEAKIYIGSEARVLNMNDYPLLFAYGYFYDRKNVYDMSGNKKFAAGKDETIDEVIPNGGIILDKEDADGNATTYVKSVARPNDPAKKICPCKDRSDNLGLDSDEEYYVHDESTSDTAVTKKVKILNLANDWQKPLCEFKADDPQNIDVRITDLVGDKTLVTISATSEGAQMHYSAICAD